MYAFTTYVLCPYWHVESLKLLFEKGNNESRVRKLLGAQQHQCLPCKSIIWCVYSLSGMCGSFWIICSLLNFCYCFIHLSPPYATELDKLSLTPFTLVFQVKQIMEEAVTRKFVHADSSHIISFCGKRRRESERARQAKSKGCIFLECVGWRLFLSSCCLLPAQPPKSSAVRVAKLAICVRFFFSFRMLNRQISRII